MAFGHLLSRDWSSSFPGLIGTRSVCRRGSRFHSPSPPPTPRPPRSGLPPTKTQPKQAAISRVPRRRWRLGTPGCPLSGGPPGTRCPAALVTVSVVLFMLLARGVFSLPMDSNGPTKSGHLLRRSIYESKDGMGRGEAISGRRCSRGNPVRSNITISCPGKNVNTDGKASHEEANSC